MKTNHLLATLTILSGLFFTVTARALDITATNSGNWGDSTIWDSGTVPGTNDDADVPQGITVTVTTNASIQYIYDLGTVVMTTNAVLDVVGDSTGAEGTQSLGLLDATAVGNTVIYAGNAFWAKHTDYYNLVFSGGGTFYNGNIGQTGDNQVSVTVGGNMIVGGAVSVQEGDDITVNGSLTIGTNSTWDCSSFNLTVATNTLLGGTLIDYDGAHGADTFNNLTLGPRATLNILDSTNWFVYGNVTNSGGAIKGIAYASINFNGSGIITGSPITMPTFTINGTYEIGTTINLLTNTPTLNGTLVFDIANPQQIILATNAGSGPTLYYSGSLDVINTGPAPVSDATYQFFNAESYGGAFTNTVLPTLSGSLSWNNDLANTGSISITGGSVGTPTITVTQSGGQLTLSWNSTTYPGFHVQTQSNSAGIGRNWTDASGGAVSPFVIAIDPASPPVFFRLSNQ